MPAKKTYTVTTPCGREFTRTTARTYTHVVVCRSPDRLAAGDDRFGPLAWCGSKDLAEKRVRYYQNCMGRANFADVQIVPVNA